MESTQSYKKRVEAYKKKEQSFMLPQQFYDAHYSSLQSTSESGTSRATSPVEYETDSGDSSSLSTQALNAIQHQQLQSLSKSGIIQQQTRGSLFIASLSPYTIHFTILSIIQSHLISIHVQITSLMCLSLVCSENKWRLYLIWS